MIGLSRKQNSDSSSATVVEAEILDKPSWPEPIKEPEVTEVEEVLENTTQTAITAPSLALKLYAGFSCITMLFIVRALHVLGGLTSRGLNEILGDRDLPTLTVFAFRLPAFLYPLPLVFLATVITGYFKKSDRLLIHCLGLMFIATAVLVFLQAAGVFALFMELK